MTYIFPKRKLNIPTIRYYPYKLTYVPIKGDKCTHTERQSNQSTDEMIAIKILPPAEGLSCFTFLRKVFSPKKTDIWSDKTGFLSQKTGFWSDKTGFWSDKPGFWSDKPGFGSQKTGFWSDKPGFWSQKKQVFGLTKLLQLLKTHFT